MVGMLGSLRKNYMALIKIINSELVRQCTLVTKTEETCRSLPSCKLIFGCDSEVVVEYRQRRSSVSLAYQLYLLQRECLRAKLLLLQPEYSCTNPLTMLYRWWFSCYVWLMYSLSLNSLVSAKFTCTYFFSQHVKLFYNFGMWLFIFVVCLYLHWLYLHVLNVAWDWCVGAFMSGMCPFLLLLPRSQVLLSCMFIL